MELDLSTHNDLEHWRRQKPASEAYIQRLVNRMRTRQIQDPEYFQEKYLSAVWCYQKICTRIEILSKFSGQ